MNHNTFEPRMRSLPETPMPKDLHAKIMKRVFIAGYGRYLYISTAVLFVNLGVLALELYKKLVSIDYAKLAQNLAEGPAVATLYEALPVQSLVATGVTAALSAYMAYIFVKFHKNPQSIGIFRGMSR